MSLGGHTTGLHALLGGGVIVSPGCTFELLARFTAANQGFANGQVLDTAAEGVTDGQLTVVDTGAGSVAISTNKLRVIGTGGWNTTGAHSPAIVKTLGKALITDVETNDVADSFYSGFNDGAVITSANRQYTFTNATSVINASVDDGGIRNTQIGAIVNNTEYQWGIVLGGYDASEVPWDDLEAAASYLYGASFFIRGGAYTDWTLLWRDSAQNVATLYAALSRNTAVDYTDWDDFRVPDNDYSAVLQPTVKDTFTDSNGTPLANHTPNVDSVGGGWAESGSIDISGNRAVTQTIASNDFGTIGTGLADAFGRITIQLVATGAGYEVFRYIDDNNLWMAGPDDNANTFSLFERNGGVWTSRASVGVAVAPTVDYETTVATDGTAIQAWLDGANRISFVSALHQAATRWGMISVQQGTQFDNFHVQPRSGYTDLSKCP